MSLPDFSIYPILAITASILGLILFVIDRRAKKLILEREKLQKQRLYQITILKEIQERIGYSLDVEKVIDVIIGSLRSVFTYSTAAALLNKNEKMVFKCFVEENVSNAFVQQVKKSMVASFTALSDRALPDTIEESLSGSILNETNTKGLASFFHIPLIINNEVVALINVSSTHPGLYKEDEMTLLYQITNEASRALTRLHEVLTTEKGKLMALIGGLADGVFMIDTSNALLVINEAAKSFLQIKKPTPSIFDIISAFSNTYDIGAKMQEAISVNKVIKEPEIQIGGRTVQIFITPVVHTVELISASYGAINQEAKPVVIGASILLHDITLEKALTQMREDFTNMMVHELRAPLTSIKDASSLLQTTPDLKQEDKDKMLQIIHEQAKVLLDEVSSLLDAAKLEAGKLALQASPSDLIKLVRERVEVFLPQAKSKHITLVSNLQENFPKVTFDPIRLTQVLNNLLSNSLKYTNNNGTVMIRCSQQTLPNGKFAVVSVSDNGIGIPKEKQHLLFSKFGQLAMGSGQRVSLSSGLGLYITKGIVEAHGGMISLESEEGRGTTVSFMLPMQKQTDDVLSAKVSPATPTTLPQPTNKIVN